MLGLVLLVLVQSGISQEACNAKGCEKCKTGFTDKCDTCKKGWGEEFALDRSTKVAYKTCKSQVSTGAILGIVLGVCGCILCIAVILLFFWVQFKRLIEKNIEFYNSKRAELIEKKQQYDKERVRVEPEIKEYVRQKSTYDMRIKEMKANRDRLEDMERRQQQDEEMKRLQAEAPTPPPMYNIFMEMERDYLQKQAELQSATSLRLPPGFLNTNPMPAPIQPITEAANYAQLPPGFANSSNSVHPPSYGSKPMAGGPEPHSATPFNQPQYQPAPYQPSGFRNA